MNAPDVRLVRNGDEYRMIVDGADIGEVHRSRFSASNSMRSRYKNTGWSNRSGFGEGHWGWTGHTPEDEYPTRREAVEDAVANYLRRRDADTNTDNQGAPK